MSFAPLKRLEVEPLPSCPLPPPPSRHGYDSSQVEPYMFRNGSSGNMTDQTPSPLTPRTAECSVFQNDNPDSPGLMRTHSYDEVLFDIRKVQPDKIAAQLTLVDLPLFKAIKIAEFANCNWTKKQKLELAPNIVAFTRRFNHTSYWVVREILNESSARLRGEIITQFIKIAKKLQDLNNIHSLKAVISGLQSPPIFRLALSWKHVHRKDKSTFDKLADFISDDDNRKNLREHMDAYKLPCIPHLGFYLSDITYLSCLPDKGVGRIDTIFNLLVYLQNSTYDLLIPEMHIQKYLKHTRYIDELLKFFEDENYKLSLELEPEPSTALRKKHRVPNSTSSVQQTPPGVLLRTSKSYEDLLTPFTTTSTANGMVNPSPQTTGAPPTSKTTGVQQKALQARHSCGILEDATLPPNFNPSRSNSVFSEPQISFKIDESSPAIIKKTATLPSVLRGGSFSGLLPNHFENPERKTKSVSEQVAHLNPPEAKTTPNLAKKMLGSPGGMKRRRGHTKSHSLGTNVLAMLGVTKTSPTNSGSHDNSPEHPPTVTRNVSLIDDSVLDDTFTSHGTLTPTGSLGNGSTSDSDLSQDGDWEEGDRLYRKLDDVDELSVDQLEFSLLIEGPLKRKVLKKNGKSVSQLRGSKKCWVQLTLSSLLLLPSKSRPPRRSSKAKVKGVMLKDCRVKYKDPSEKQLSDKEFIIVSEHGDQTRYTAKTAKTAHEWVERIRRVITEEELKAKREVERSLIKL